MRSPVLVVARFPGRRCVQHDLRKRLGAREYGFPHFRTDELSGEGILTSAIWPLASEFDHLPAARPSIPCSLSLRTRPLDH